MLRRWSPVVGGAIVIDIPKIGDGTVIMTSTELRDPFFMAVTSPAFHRDQIADLAAGRCAAIRVPGLMSEERCAQVMAALETIEFDSYDEARVYPAVMRCGVGVSDHRVDGRVDISYWAALDRDRDRWSGMDLPFDPFAECRAAIGAHWPRQVEVGRHAGRRMGAGVAREPNNGFQVHFDDAIGEFDGILLVANLVAQFAFNLYLSVPRAGGETVVWRHRWQPADEALRLPNSYGYSELVVDAAESFELKPAVGEGLLFDPRNYHAVRPSLDARRVALGFSIGLTDTGDLLAWG